MENGDCNQCYSKYDDYGRVIKRCHSKSNPEKLTFTGNFTRSHKLFDIHFLDRRASMRKDIVEAVIKRTESIAMEKDNGQAEFTDDNPMYEDPRDVIGQKPAKPPRKRNLQGIAVTSPRLSKEGRSLLRDQKKKLTRKYESLITTLMDRCEENVVLLTEKDTLITKLRDKLKAVLEYNKLFAEENDQLKSQYSTLVQYVEECKQAVKGERERSKGLENRCKELEERVKQYEVPDREFPEPSTAIPLVEVCMSCSSRQIILNQAREQNCRLQKDMQAMKDVLYRLNVQLSRYQEKLRSNIQGIATDGKGDHAHKPGETLDSLITASLGYKGTDASTDDGHAKSAGDDHGHAARTVDLSGLLSAQALAPLFDAYQENLQEKDSLILDYEKQFEAINKKSKQIVEENKILSEKVAMMEQELVQARQSYKKYAVERETADIEKATLVERAVKAEAKLKEVYEMYEDKMSAMMRDYETVHREYFTVKSALEASEGKLAQLDVLRARTVPADLHERRLDHCKRLLEELKHQYSMESERKTEQLAKLQDQLRVADDKHKQLCREHDAVKDELKQALKNVKLLEELKHQYSMESERKTEQLAKLRDQLRVADDKHKQLCRENDAVKDELKQALKNVKLYRKAAVVFRQRVKAATARATRVRRSARRARGNNEPLRQALDTLERIKKEIKVVKSRASTSLEELERRIVEQERRFAQAQGEYRRSLERASLALQHKEGIIRSLIDKVADVEEVRLSQVNTQRLQGIVTDSDKSPSPSQEKKERPPVKMVPGPGGYFQEKEGKKRTK